jgi:DNA-binding NtrC family response regulator
MRRYLIVDDNQAFAENLAEIIGDSGAEAEVVSTGAEALERAANTQYDALLSDMRMPLMSGAELVHRIRRVDPGLPAIVITAYTHDDDLLKARQEGLLAVLPKPTPVGRLVELLASARRDGLVALVEDDAAFADNLSEALRSRGYAAVTAATVSETERIGDVKPFAALVDLRLPGGSDGAGMRALAAKFPGLPMLVITAFSDIMPPIPHQGVFEKPFSTEALLGAVERLHKTRNV